MSEEHAASMRPWSKTRLTRSGGNVANGSTIVVGGANVRGLMTLDRYAHLMADDLNVVAQALDKAARTAADWARHKRSRSPGLSP